MKKIEAFIKLFKPEVVKEITFNVFIMLFFDIFIINKNQNKIILDK